jgi:choline monooxygenase
MEASARSPITREEFEAVAQPLLEASTMPPEVYWSPEIHDREMEQIWFKEWICVGRTEDIPEAGDYFTRTLATESIIIVRDGEGEIRAHLNVCRHRGCQIIGASADAPVNEYGIPFPPPESGNIKSFRCPYHGWMYALNGELRGTPDFKETRNFDKGDYSLASLRVDIWNNFIFVNLDENAAPFADGVRDMHKWDFDLYDPASMVTVARWDRSIDCNWKVFVENSAEEYHLPWVHPGLQDVTPMKGWRTFPEITEEGWMLIVGQYPGASVQENGELLFAPRPGLVDVRPEFDGLPLLMIFPSLTLMFTSDILLWRMTVPEGPERSMMWHGACIPKESADALAAGDAEAAEKVQILTSALEGVGNEDVMICERQQRGVRSRHAMSGRYSKHESLAWVFDKRVVEKAHLSTPAGDATNGNAG